MRTCVLCRCVIGINLTVTCLRSFVCNSCVGRRYFSSETLYPNVYGFFLDFRHIQKIKNKWFKIILKLYIRINGMNCYKVLLYVPSVIYIMFNCL